MILGGFDQSADINITNLIDLHLNLRKRKLNQELYFVENEYRSYFRYISKYYNELDIYNLPIREKIIEDDLIITTFDFLKKIFLGIFKINLKCKRLIILDSSDVIEVCEKYSYNFYNNFLPTITRDIHVLGNPFIIDYYLVNNQYIYYNKLSFERLELLKTYEQKDCSYLEGNSVFIKNYLKENNIKYAIDINDCYSYRDMYFVRNDHDFFHTVCLNFPKRIFEFNYLNKFVYYFNKKEYNDGLTEYLKLFDIDDNLTQHILIDKDLLIKKLFFHDDDVLLNLL